MESVLSNWNEIQIFKQVYRLVLMFWFCRASTWTSLSPKPLLLEPRTCFFTPKTCLPSVSGFRILQPKMNRGNSLPWKSHRFVWLPYRQREYVHSLSRPKLGLLLSSCCQELYQAFIEVFPPVVDSSALALSFLWWRMASIDVALQAVWALYISKEAKHFSNAFSCCFQQNLNCLTLSINTWEARCCGESLLAQRQNESTHLTFCLIHSPPKFSSPPLSQTILSPNTMPLLFTSCSSLYPSSWLPLCSLQINWLLTLPLDLWLTLFNFIYNIQTESTWTFGVG